MNSKCPELFGTMFDGLLRDLEKRHSVLITKPSTSLWFGSLAKVRATIAGLGHIGKLLDWHLATHGTEEPWELIKHPEFDEAIAPQDVKDWCFDLLIEVAIQSSPIQAKVLRQAFLFFSKLNLPHETDATTQAYLDYVDRDRALGTLWSSEYRTLIRQSDIIFHAREFITRVLAGLPRDYSPKHGPGAVANKEEDIHKMDFFFRPGTRFPFDEWFYLSPTHVSDVWGFDQRCKPEVVRIRRTTIRSTRKGYRAQRRAGLATSQWFDQPESGFRSCSRVIAVPKDFRGPRIISAEPKENMWLQQGIWETIADRVHTHSYTKDSINFEDQELSRADALKASITNARATIDLKEASDRIALDLVYLLFGDERIRDVYLDMLDTRSRWSDVPGIGRVKLRKFAPMGSALCFPIQSLVFLALCVGSIAGSRDNRRVPYASLARRFRVFGDDIILPRDDASRVIPALEMAGLKLNLNKCCLNGPFKESCGMDAYQGIDVTPIRWRTVVGRCIEAEDLDAISRVHNLLRTAGFLITADIVLAVMRERLPHLLVLPENWGPSLPFGAFISGRRICNKIRCCQKHQTLYAYTYQPDRRKTSWRQGWSSLLYSMSNRSLRPMRYTRSFSKHDRLKLTWMGILA